jgi:hypothetical protein
MYPYERGVSRWGMRSGEGRHTEADGPRSIQRRIRPLLERTKLSHLEHEETADFV